MQSRISAYKQLKIYLHSFFFRLFVSPQFPPTPEQKKVTPQQWLSEDYNEGDMEVLSLDQVRRNLVKDIEAAEEINEVHYESYRGEWVG